MTFLSRLSSGLSRTSQRLGSGISGIFTGKKLDEAALSQLEDLLIAADLGASVAAELTERLARQKFGKEVSEAEIKAALVEQITVILAPCAIPLRIDATKKPHVVMVAGVNGNGKTTTIGKLAAKMKAEGKTVCLAAADTFRAAAVEQLQVWGERTHSTVITGEANSDPASVAYRALEQAKAVGMDVLLIDTAGRLHNKTDLMAELQKITKVLHKLDESAPHSVLQVLDATTGQNAISQVETFRAIAGVTGLIITKLDGTAKGGIVVALARKFGLPIHAVGIGEGVEDLDTFNAEDFARRLLNT